MYKSTKGADGESTIDDNQSLANSAFEEEKAIITEASNMGPLNPEARITDSAKDKLALENKELR
jgi:hypothetical protein